MDHYSEKWRYIVPPIEPIPYDPNYINIIPNQIINFAPLITQEEINEFRTLLERAREYDKRHNEPDCELDEKKKTLLEIAKQLGVDISL